jgi:predicted ester cyclase
MHFPVRGLEAVRQVVAGYFKAFPDMHFEIDQIIASGDYVVGRWRCTATHRGEFNASHPPTGKSASVGVQ